MTGNAADAEDALHHPRETRLVHQHELFHVADLGVEVQGNGFATSKSYFARYRDTVINALKGFVEAIYSRIHSEVVRSLPGLVGSIGQFVDSTDVLSCTSRSRDLGCFYTGRQQGGGVYECS
jgi:hypothetical protein